MTIVYILAAILIFGLLVAVHELGHFLAAKACGVRVNEFSIGMGPVIWSRDTGETQYSLRAFPMGGFCAMEGEEEESDSEYALTNQSLWKQLLIFVAGAFMNLVTGFVILLVIYASATGFWVPTISGTAPEFEAVNGTVLEAGDVLWQINGERVYLASDVSLLMGLNSGKPMELVVLRNGEKVDVGELQWSTFTDMSGNDYQGYGIYRKDTIEKANFANKIKYSWRNTMDFVRIVRLSLKMLFTGEAGVDDLSGPVGIVSAMTETGEQAEATGGVLAALESMAYFGAMIAVNLCVMNLLPIPGLDGGHILLLLVDAAALLLFGKKVPEKYTAAINGVGLMLLMGFILFVTFHDVTRLLG